MCFFGVKKDIPIPRDEIISELHGYIGYQQVNYLFSENGQRNQPTISLETKYAKGHGKVFFLLCPRIGNFSVPFQTLRTSNEPMTIIVLVYVRLCEAALRCIILEGMGKKDLSMLNPPG